MRGKDRPKTCYVAPSIYGDETKADPRTQPSRQRAEQLPHRTASAPLSAEDERNTCQRKPTFRRRRLDTGRIHNRSPPCATRKSSLRGDAEEGAFGGNAFSTKSIDVPFLGTRFELT